MKTFHSTDGSASVTVIDQRPLHPALEVAHHADAFGWGYSGKGPLQLALAICVELVGPVRAEAVYRQFKDRVIAPLPKGQGWRLDEYTCLAEIKAIEAQI